MKRRFLSAAPMPGGARVLPRYAASRLPLGRFQRLAWLSGFALIALIYGSAAAIFPPFFYSFFSVPLIGLALISLWALPDTNSDYGRPIRSLFWLYMLSVLLWPSYLAIALPGLPWINVQRLFLLPLCALTIYAFCTNKQMRRELGEVLRANSLATKLFVSFVVIQFITTPFSPIKGTTLNKLFINQCEWTVVFLLSCWMFRDSRDVKRWYNCLLVILLLVAAEAFLEYHLHKVPWRDHVPAFLKESQDYLQANLRRATGLYRTKGFTVNTLVLAELMGITAPFVIHAAFSSPSIVGRIFWTLFTPVHFAVILTTDARLGMVGFFLSALVYVGVWSVKRWRERRQDLLAPAIVIAYPVGAAAFIALSLVWTRLYRLVFGGGANAASDIARQTQWKMMWPKLLHWPFGHGTASSGETLGYVDAAGLLTVDSYYITLLLDFGILGLAVFCCLFLIPSFQLLHSSIRLPAQKPDLRTPVAVSMISFLLIKSVLSLQPNHTLMFMILGLGFALTYRVREEERKAARSGLGAA